MRIRIQLSRVTVKDLHSRLQHAYQRDGVRLVRRITVLIDLLVHHGPMAVLCERWGLSPSCLYDWQKAFLLRGMDSVVYDHGGGRRPQLTPRQKKRLVELIEAGPLVVGFETACQQYQRKPHQRQSDAEDCGLVGWASTTGYGSILPRRGGRPRRSHVLKET